jgi:tetratricopeptide (TPR) repeat protein
MRKILFALLFVCAIPVFSQNYSVLYDKAMKLKSEYKYVESLAMFQLLLKSDSSNVDYLANGSTMYTKAGNLQPDEKKRFDYYHQGEYLAKKAIAKNPNNAEAHYAYSLVIGRLNEHASSKQKVANAKLIKSEADACLRLQPDHAGAYHILGRWHSTVAGFGIVEKMAINALFGGVPEGGSYDEAVKCFKKAIQLEPAYILHYYELANVLKERDASAADKNDAIAALKKAMSLGNQTPDDPSTKKKCEELLKELQ